MKRRQSSLLFIAVFPVLLITLGLGLYYLLVHQPAIEEQADAWLGREFYNVPYTNPSNDANAPALAMDFYLPLNRVYKRSPVVVFFHGGSFIAGDKGDIRYPSTGDTLNVLRENGFAVVSVQYRLLNDRIHFPTNLDDAKRAVLFIQENAGDYGLDASRIATWGYSAGASIALSLAYGEPDLAIYAVVDISGPTDLVRALHASELNDAFSFNYRNMLSIYFGDGDPELMAPDVSPYQLASARSPATLILHGDRDDVVDVTEATRLAARLEVVGAVNNLVLFDGHGHGLGPLSEAVQARINETTVNFLQQHLP